MGNGTVQDPFTPAEHRAYLLKQAGERMVKAHRLEARAEAEPVCAAWAKREADAARREAATLRRQAEWIGQEVTR